MAVNPLPRCTITPQPHKQFAFSIDNREVTRWHFADDAPRPYFFPIVGPSGQSLTRMGHPGAPNHDHHRSLWFAHHDLMGHDFWSENKPSRIRQNDWFAIADSDEGASLAVELFWLDGHDPRPLVRQTLVATIRPLEASGEWTLELQCDFRASGEGVRFEKNNFGILGLRVAKSMSVVFGAGEITGANGQQGEPQLFGNANRWMDYSGPVTRDALGKAVSEGLTLIDHRSNPHHPTKWHVRSDGWIGPSLSRDEAIHVPTNRSLSVRFLLHVHAGKLNAHRANELADQFDRAPALTVVKSTEPHNQWRIQPAR